MRNFFRLLSGSAFCLMLGMGLGWQRSPAAPPVTSPSIKPSVLSVKQQSAEQTDTPTSSTPAVTESLSLSDAQLKTLHVNEVGRVPILEYHELGPNPRGAGYATRMMHRSVEEFEQDLQRLYEEGYRPVNLSEYLDNKMPLAAGTSPVILTFDDARSTQFRYRSDGSLSPTCAIGLLQAFHENHPDWLLKGMFYVLPEGAFGSEMYASKKMRALLKMGFELGNHTRSHNYFNRMSDAAIIKEIAQGKRLTEKMAPGANLNTLALPGGCKPRSHNYGVLKQGVYKGTYYTNRAVLDAWGGNAPSTISVKFDPLRIPRVLGVNGSGGVEEALDELKENRGQRYVCSGDPTSVTIPIRLAKFVNTARLHGLPLRTYDDGRKPTADDTPKAPPKSRHRKPHRKPATVQSVKKQT